MGGVLADVACRDGHIAGKLMLDGHVPLLDDGGLEDLREYSDTPAGRACDCRTECREAIADLLADKPVIVLQEEIVDIRRIHRQATVSARRFQVVQDSIGHANY